MKSFKRFILTEGVRIGLPHITTMDHNQLKDLIGSGHIDISNTTEKTDGQTFAWGHDEHGFWSQSSGSGKEKMRSPGDYETRARRRSVETGKPLDLTASNIFSHVHRLLQDNPNHQTYLKKAAEKQGGSTMLRGEVFYKPIARPSEHKGEIKFVGTSYHPKHMGDVGMIVLHSKLPDNAPHDIAAIKRTKSKDLNFDDDTIKHPPVKINVQKHVDEFNKLDHNLLNSRTVPSNKERKLAEIAKLDKIKQDVSKKVDKHINSLGLSVSKWSNAGEPEGLVIHPPSSNPSQPRFKVTSQSFRDFKASGVDFKKRN